MLAPAILSVILGFLFELLRRLLFTVLLPVVGFTLNLEVRSASRPKVGSFSIMIAVISAVIPIRQIANLDLAMVFRGK